VNRSIARPDWSEAAPGDPGGVRKRLVRRAYARREDYLRLAGAVSSIQMSS
jgi:hypothetical protein